jgi:hypothetical protein
MGVEVVVPRVSEEVNVGLPDGWLKLYVRPAGGERDSDTDTALPPTRFTFTE